MITRENLREVMDCISEDDVTDSFFAKGDYVKLELFVFNSGWKVDLTVVEYDEHEEEEITSNGNIYCDKMDFARLVEESGTCNEKLVEYYS